MAVRNAVQGNRRMASFEKKWSSERPELFYESQAVQGSRRLAVGLKKTNIHGGFLASANQGHAVGRSGELESSLQQIQVVGCPGLQPGVMQKRSGELRSIDRNGHNLGVLPVQLRHFPRRGLAMGAGGIVEEQERLSLLQRERLSIHCDGWGGLQTRRPRRIHAK